MSSLRATPERAGSRPMGTLRVFAYGTLLVPEIFEVVIGRRPLGRTATLTGYARFRMRGERFPAVVAQAGSETRGLLFDDIRPDELDKLDRYEGEMYQRVSVQLVVAGAGASEALVYVLRPEHRDCLSAEPWEAERFACEEVDRFMREEFG